MDIKEKIEKRLDDEFENYLEEISKISNDNLIELSYEITCKRIIAARFCELSNLTQNQMKTLSDVCENLLEYLYKAWIKMDTDIDSVISESICAYFIPCGVNGFILAGGIL